MSYFRDWIEYVKKLPNLELEVRFGLDINAFESAPLNIKSKIKFTKDNIRSMLQLLVEEYKSQKIEQSMRFINTIDKTQMLFHERYFENGEQVKNKHKSVRKYKEVKPIYGISREFPIAVPFKIGASREEEVTGMNEVILKKADKVRIRQRLAIDLGEWRIDITFTKNISGPSVRDMEFLKRQKTLMFTTNNPAEFIEKSPWDQASTIELEVEYIGDDITLEKFSIVRSILGTMSKSVKTEFQYQIALWKIAQKVQHSESNKFQPPDARFGIKHLGVQVQYLNKGTWYEVLKPAILENTIAVSDKPDGLRCLINLQDTNMQILTHELQNITVAPQEANLVVDSERIENRIYVIDVLYFDQPLTKQTYIQRLAYRERACKILATATKELTFEPKYIDILVKETYAEQIKKCEQREKPYDSDGLIFTPLDKGYFTQVFKWKDTSHNTIDFLIMAAPKKLQGIAPYLNKPNKTLYILFVGIRREEYEKWNLKLIQHYLVIFQQQNINIDTSKKYFPIQFCPSDRPFAHVYLADDSNLSGHVGEFIYKDDEWNLVKLRVDRDVEVKRGSYYGNDYKVAENNWRSYNNPLTFEELTDSKDIAYFNSDNVISCDMRKYISKLKYVLLEPRRNSPFVMDLACGRGSALLTFFRLKMHTALFIDKDASALDSLIQRKHTIDHHGFKMGIYTQTLDLSSGMMDNMKKIKTSCIPLPLDGVPLITCFLAMSYFSESKTSMFNFIEFVDQNLAKKGTLVLLYFNGAKLHETLKDNRAISFDICGDKYKIVRRYEDEELLNYGQAIDFKCAFTGGQYYREYLTNPEYLINTFKKCGITICESGNSLDMPVGISVNPMEKAYLHFLDYLIFTR